LTALSRGRQQAHLQLWHLGFPFQYDTAKNSIGANAMSVAPIQIHPVDFQLSRECPRAGPENTIAAPIAFAASKALIHVQEDMD
jgi:hypothetical protein